MYETILVPVDGSVTSQCGLQEAIKIAAHMGGRIRLIHVVNELIFDGACGVGGGGNDVFQALREGGRRILAQAENLVRLHGVAADSVTFEAVGSAAADFILAEAVRWPAALIVMGTHGRRGFARLAVGSDAEMVVRGSTVPVLLVRHDRRRAATTPGSTTDAAA